MEKETEHLGYNDNGHGHGHGQQEILGLFLTILFFIWGCR